MMVISSSSEIYKMSNKTDLTSLKKIHSRSLLSTRYGKETARDVTAFAKML